MKVSAPFEPGLVVRDLEKALIFYRDVLGMNVVATNDVPAEITQRAGLTMNGYRVVRLDTDGGDRLKIMGPKDAPAANPSPDLILSRTGFVFLTFIVPDIKAVLAKLNAAGATVRTRRNAGGVQARRVADLCRRPRGQHDRVRRTQRSPTRTGPPRANVCNRTRPSW